MADIPQQKKSPQELREVVRQHSLEPLVPQSIVHKKILHPLGVGVCYILSLAGLGILFYPLIVWKRPLSSHHGGFMCFLSLLVMVFAGGYYFHWVRIAGDKGEVRGDEFTYQEILEESADRGRKEEMSTEQLERYLEELRQENENDPDYKKWIENQPKQEAPESRGS